MRIGNIVVATSNDLRKMYDAAIGILQTVGMRVTHETVLDRLEAYGAKVSRVDRVVKIPANVIDKAIAAIKKASGKYSPAQEGPFAERFEVSLGDGCFFLYDFEKKTRCKATRDDYISTVRFADAVPEVTQFAAPVEIGDVPVPMMVLEMQALSYLHSAKPSRVENNIPEQVKYLDELHKIPSLSNPKMTRTVLFLYGLTKPGQDMFLRGGIDHAYAQKHLGKTCTAHNKLCAMPIRHLSIVKDDARTKDYFLDWYGAESGQGGAQGSPAAWTTNKWPSSWGQRRTVAKDGYGETPLNTYGHHYWMLDVMMDCSKGVSGWFEFKSYISNGPGWEGSMSQPNAPYQSWNHFARCGYINVFRRNQSHPVEIKSFPTP